MNRVDKERYFETKDEDGTTILCPIEVAGSRNFEDCVEEDVVRRYSGNIEAVHETDTDRKIGLAANVASGSDFVPETGPWRKYASR